jgi:pyridoxal phosphate enzyme (YggS family)
VSDPSSGATPSLEERLANIRSRIDDAARAAGRRDDELTLIVVTKFHPVGLVRELAALGVHDFGENRHQEARDKAAELPDERWHFVGQLQGKKARQVRAYADVVHSLDRAALVPALAGGESQLEVFLQVNLTPDPARGGAQPADVPALADEIAAAAGLRLLGVMAGRAFDRLAAVGEEVRRTVPAATAMSAGMSGDFEDAIRYGATHLRIGTAITGPRPAPQ